MSALESSSSSPQLASFAVWVKRSSFDRFRALEIHIICRHESGPYRSIVRVRKLQGLSFISRRRTTCHTLVTCQRWCCSIRIDYFEGDGPSGEIIDCELIRYLFFLLRLL